MINISFQFNNPQETQGFIDFLRTGPMAAVEGLVMNALIQLQQQSTPEAPKAPEVPVDNSANAPVDPNT